MDDNLLSFQDKATVPVLPDAPADTPKLTGIWKNLYDAIQGVVDHSGIDQSQLLPGERTEDLKVEAVEQIYQDIADLYYWYFEPEQDEFFVDNDRLLFIDSQKNVSIPSSLRGNVAPVVKYILDDMRENGDIPAGRDVDGLDAKVTDDLSRYILNWQDWYYDYRDQLVLENYYEQASIHDELYNQSDYGQLSNLIDNNVYSTISDLPPGPQAT